MIELKYFASLRDILSCDSEQFPLESITTVAKLRQELATRGDSWETQLLGQQTLVAVNQQIATADTEICPGDEVAFFPPVTGG